MNDTDLTAALHRDADLVGAPSADLLEQLTHRRARQRRQRTGVLTAVLGVVVIAAGIPLGGALMNSSDGGPATDPVPSITTEVTPTTTPAPTTVHAAPPPVEVPATIEEPAPVEAPATSVSASAPASPADAGCPDDTEIMAALPPLDGGDHFDLTGSRPPVCSAEWAATFPRLVLGSAPAGGEIVPTLLEHVDGAWSWVYQEQPCQDGSLPEDIQAVVCDY